MYRFLSTTGASQASVNPFHFDADDDGALLPPMGSGGGLSRSNSITGDEATLLKPYEADSLSLSIKLADGLSRHTSWDWAAAAIPGAAIPPMSPSVLTRERSYNPSSVFDTTPQLGEGGGSTFAAGAAAAEAAAAEMGLGGFLGVDGGLTEEDLGLFDPDGMVGADALDVPAEVEEEERMEEERMHPTLIPAEVEAVPNAAAARRSSRTTRPVVPMLASTPTVAATPKGTDTPRSKSKSSRSKRGGKGKGEKRSHAPAKRLAAKPANAASTVTVAVAASSYATEAHRLADKLCWQGAPRPADGTSHGQKIVSAGCRLVWDADFRSDGGSWIHPRVQPDAVAADEEVLASRKTDSRYDALAKSNRAAAVARLKAKRACGRVNGAPISHYRDRGEAASGRVRVGGRFVKKSTGGFVSQDQLKRKQKGGSR